MRPIKTDQEIKTMWAETLSGLAIIFGGITAFLLLVGGLALVAGVLGS